MSLFTVNQKIEIVEITGKDIKTQTDNYKLFEGLINKHEANYPEIQTWLKEKVCAGINSEERKAWIGLVNEKPIASAVIKHGAVSKFCHLHIEENLRHQHLGDIFFSLMAVEVKRLSKSVYFTLPEGLWEEKSSFFSSFGFEHRGKYSTQYRKGEEELFCETDFNNLWSHVLNKLPEIHQLISNDPQNPLNGILMSIQPEYVAKIFKGEKTVEIRTKFDKKWKGHMATIYSTHPSKYIAGFAKIKDVVEDTPECIWEKFSNDVGCNSKDFFQYAGKHEKVYALVFDNIEPFTDKVPISWLNSWLNADLKAPQSYSIINNNTNWKTALSLTQMLHKNFNAAFQIF